MRLRISLVVVIASLLAPRLATAQSLDPIFISGHSLSYKGYKAFTSYNALGRISVAVIKKGKRVLAKMLQEDNQEGFTRIGLFPFLGGATKQLIIQQYLGGAHCCYHWR